MTDAPLAQRNADNVIVLHHLTSGQQVVLDPLEGRNRYELPRWSPDGTQLVFRADRAPGRFQFWRVNVDGTDLTLLVDETAHPVAWSPDGTQLAVALAAGGLYLVDAADGSRRLLAPGPIQDVAWSPDGTRIAAARNTGPGLIRPWYQLIVVDVATGTVSALTDGQAFHGRPAWSPTGRQIAFVSDRNDPVYPDLWLINADGSHARAVTERRGISWAHTPDWNPVTCAEE